MTDKQIIIDGVDISKCKHYDEVFNYCDQSYLGEGGLLKNTKNPKRCECSPNCYYKQLKRKERECEELKNIINEAKNSKLDLKSFLVGEAVQNEYEHNLTNYKQTLAEIKEIAENMNEECFYDDFDCMNCDMQNGCTYFSKNQILQKIREVIKDEN